MKEIVPEKRWIATKEISTDNGLTYAAFRMKIIRFCESYEVDVHTFEKKMFNTSLGLTTFRRVVHIDTDKLLEIMRSYDLANHELYKCILFSRKKRGF